MGAAASSRTPHAVLRQEYQVHFRRYPLADVAELVKGWFEDAAPLGLSKDVFTMVLNLNNCPYADELFLAFDTDRNQKVDALEVLCAAVVLCGDGTIDEKIEILFPVFDFSGAGKMNFDETNILVHSVIRGLLKVCGSPEMSEEEVIEVCRRMFDAHNLSYDNTLNKEQVRRWLKSDTGASKLVDAFHNSFSLPVVENDLAQKEQAQAAAFSDLCGTYPCAPKEHVLSCDPLLKALGSPPPDALSELIEVVTGLDGNVNPVRFVEGARAWNAFNTVDVNGAGEVAASNLSSSLVPKSSGANGRRC